jgi:4,5-dihydroxyphthalate decarboxylase
MAKLKLRLLIGDYESTRALREGTVTVEGCELEFTPYPGYEDIHFKVAREDICDVGEFNGPAYVAGASKNWHLAAIPVFLHRRFRHGFIFINKNSGIKKPTDLIGKKVANPIFQPACNVWMRGILENEHNVPHKDVIWVTGGPEIVPFTPKAGVRIEQTDKDLDEMLISGEVDAYLSPNMVKGIREKLPHIGHLWENYEQLDMEWFKKTNLFPIMHVTTIKKEIVEKHPWVCTALMDAFEKSKQLAYKRMVNPRIVPLVLMREYWEQERKIFGPDPWAYGITDNNRKNLDLMSSYVHQQGMSDKLMTPEDLFPADTIAWKPKPL